MSQMRTLGYAFNALIKPVRKQHYVIRNISWSHVISFCSRRLYLLAPLKLRSTQVLERITSQTLIVPIELANKDAHSNYEYILTSQISHPKGSSIDKTPYLHTRINILVAHHYHGYFRQKYTLNMTRMRYFLFHFWIELLDLGFK